MSKNKLEKLKKRKTFLEQQIAAGSRLDGYSLQGHKEELEEVIKKINNLPPLR
tara:strand:- start:519 stop:677 length:159 start_codon:yes stop_codon:yes gene_type:complete